jgi:hypothetical protein
MARHELGARLFVLLEFRMLEFLNSLLRQYLCARLFDSGPTFFRFADFLPEKSRASRVLAPFSFDLGPALRYLPLPLLVD